MAPFAALFADFKLTSRTHRGRFGSALQTNSSTPVTIAVYMRLPFWGAAGTVPGSMHLVESGARRVLLDCGLYQGRRKDADAKNRNLPFPGASIAAAILSHAHIDHSGTPPPLVKNGSSAPIYPPPA